MRGVGANHLQAVDPQPAFNRATSGNAGDAKHEQTRVGSGGESTVDLSPEVRVSKVVAHEESSFAIEILNGEFGAAGAVHAFGFVESGKFVAGTGFDGD